MDEVREECFCYFVLYFPQTLSYEYYANQVSEDQLEEELKEIHLNDIAYVLEHWESIAPKLGLSHNPHVTDAKDKYQNHPDLQR